MMVVRDSGDMMQESSTEPDIDDHVRKESGWTTNLRARQRYLQYSGWCQRKIGSGSANGVEEEEDTSTLDCRVWSQEEKYRDDVNGG